MKKTGTFLIILFISISCKKESKLEQDIMKINSNITIERFDKLFANAKVDDLSNLKQAYPFMFAEQYPDSFWIAKKEDTLQQQLFKEVEKAFPSLDDVELKIESLYNHLKYYFPEFNPPRVITTTSMVDYRNKVIVTDTIALVSIDNYLGSDHEFYAAFKNTSCQI